MYLSTADERNIEKQGIFVPTTVTNKNRETMKYKQAAKVAAFALWNPDVATATKELLDSFSPDVVHLHKLYPQLSVAPVVIAARRNVTVVQTIHDCEFISASTVDNSGSWLDRDEKRIAYRTLNTVLFGVKRLVHVPRVNNWISVSRTAGEISSKYGIDTTVVPHFTEPRADDLPAFKDRKGVVFVGRLSEEKGFPHVLELARLLPEMSIVVVGDGVLEAEVRQAEGCLKGLSYRGRLDPPAVARELALARLVIMPSLRWEPGGLVALEAMAAGTPVVAYDRGGFAEYVRDAGAGIIVAPTATSMAEAVALLYDDRERWEGMSSRAREAIDRDHCHTSYIDRIENVYLQAINSK